jgi:hypothetical protein
MKLTSLCIILCTLSLPCLIHAQPSPLPDSIRIESPDAQGLIVFKLRDYHRDKELIRSFPSRLTTLLDHIRKSTTESGWSTPHRVTITYADGKNNADTYEMRIEQQKTPATHVSIKQNAVVELLPPGWELDIKGKHFEIYVYAPDLEQLTKVADTSLDPVITQLDSDPATTNQTRMGFISRNILSNGTVTPTKITHRQVGDMLELSAGAGVGLLQERFYPEVNLITALHLSNRFISQSQRILFSYELKLFSRRNTEGEFQYTPSSFINASWGLNFSKGRPRWTSIGFGYMIHNKADHFTGKTMKIFVESDIGSSKLNLIPELYLTDDFKRSLFGVKLQYKF